MGRTVRTWSNKSFIFNPSISSQQIHPEQVVSKSLCGNREIENPDMQQRSSYGRRVKSGPLDTTKCQRISPKEIVGQRQDRGSSTRKYPSQRGRPGQNNPREKPYTREKDRTRGPLRLSQWM